MNTIEDEYCCKRYIEDLLTVKPLKNYSQQK